MTSLAVSGARGGCRDRDEIAEDALARERWAGTDIGLELSDGTGPLVKNYVFNLVPDTTLRSLRVKGFQPASFKPDVLTRWRR